MSIQEIHSIEIMDDQGSLSLIEIVSYARVERARIVEMVEAGLLDPQGTAIDQWQFANRDLRRLQAAQRLVNDLSVNLSGAALILDLIEERDALLARMAVLEKLVDVL
jgi:chaperone modulatory protein CbpM